MILNLLRRSVRLPFELRAAIRDRRLGSRPSHYLSICAIFKNEAEILGEWLRFHLGVGFEHFYLYDNGSTDRFREIVAPFVEKGVVTLIDWPENPGQLPAYRHCVDHFGDESRWIAFIDLDEFLFSPVSVNVRSVLENHEDTAGLGVYSFFYGSSGHQSPPGTPVTSTFTRRAKDRITFKTIANPRRVRRINSVHFFYYWGKQYERVSYIDWKGKTAKTPSSSKIIDAGELRINHYWSRSIQELTQRKSINDAVAGTSRSHLIEEWLAAEKLMNAVEDRQILPVVRSMDGG